MEADGWGIDADTWDDFYLSTEDGHWMAALQGQSSVYLKAWAGLREAEAQQDWLRAGDCWQAMVEAAKGKESKPWPC